MKRKIVRTVAGAIVCASLLMAHTSCSDSEIDYNDLVASVSEDANISFDEICYFASWTFGEEHHIAVVGYKKPSLFANKYEKLNKFYKVDYIVDTNDFEELQELTGTFEALMPFENKVINKLYDITTKYNPTQTVVAELNENGNNILNDLVK